MREKEIKIQFSDALILTTDYMFRKGVVTMHSDDSLDLAFFQSTANTYKAGDTLPLLDILVDPLTMKDISSE